MSNSCSCPAELGQLVELASRDSLPAAGVVDLSGRAINIARAANSCPGGCARTRRYGQALLETLGKVLDYLGALWQTTYSRFTQETLHESNFGNHSGGRVNYGTNKTPRVTVTRLDHVTLGRLTLDDTETNLLMQETVRSLTAAINGIALEISTQADEAGSELDDKDCRDAWRDLLDRTYAELASRRASLRS